MICYTHTRNHIHSHSYTHAITHTHTLTNTHAKQQHTFPQTQLHTHTRALAYTHTHTHTHTLRRERVSICIFFLLPKNHVSKKLLTRIFKQGHGCCIKTCSISNTISVGNRSFDFGFLEGVLLTKCERKKYLNCESLEWEGQSC